MDCSSYRTVNMEEHTSQQVHLVSQFAVKEEPQETANISELELRDDSNGYGARRVTAERRLTQQRRQRSRNSGRKTLDQELFTCVLCELQFEELKYLQRHMMMGHGLTAMEDIWDTPLAPESGMGLESNSKEARLTLRSERCSISKTFQVATESNEIICDKEFLKDVFPVDDSPSFCCRVCDTEFDGIPALELHSRTAHVYVCCYCERGFDGPEILKTHLSGHSDDGLFACSCCDACFPQKCRRERHMRSKHGRELDGSMHSTASSGIFCSISSRTFRTVSMLQRHERRHGDLTRSVCDICGRSYINLSLHMRTHSNENAHRCDKCGLEFRTRSALKSHRRIHAAPYGPDGKIAKLHACPCCEKKYSRMSHVRSHLLTHSGNLTCAECETVCSDSVKFKEHLLDHEACGAPTQSRQCVECGARLTDAKSLETHRLKFHETDAPKPTTRCKQCGKTLFQECNLKRHAMTCAMKLYRCPFCSQRFNSFSILYRHARRKHNETIQNNGPRSIVKCDPQNIANLTPKPYEESYECSVCGIILSFLHNLKRHMTTHTGETPYQCETCGKEFRDQGNLRRHSFTHSGEKRYACFHCGKCFTQSGTMKQHIAKQHQQPVGSVRASPIAGTAATNAGSRLKRQPRSNADVTDVSLIAIDQLTSVDILRLSDIVMESPVNTTHCGETMVYQTLT